MREEADFVNTIVRLMRLTRQGKLEWQRTTPSSFAGGLGLASTYTAEIKNLRFSLEDTRSRLLESMLDLGIAFSYRLVITDLDKNEEIVSPPLQAANDLAAIVRGYGEGKLEEINRLLDAEL